MPKTPHRAAALGGTADDIETAFYEAMQRGDIEALMACWADDDEVYCVHPGGPRLVGAAAIRATFEVLFAVGPIRITPARVRKIESLASAVHNVLERIDALMPDGSRQSFILATNVYHKTAQGWRIVAHHASPGTSQVPDEAVEPPQTLH